ncbi:serine hydrolase [Bradyrhizobium lablabi]|uniref:serine hydrolase n=1 Tax=Bradyrhizobium lablabi TaxID=722472 RepID=UPI001BA717D6|nr:serine hydrolase [Bradyrhizobium lablabi]MBR1122502.1 serine hydrolase [Bradyrhizobium lablabi]
MLTMKNTAIAALTPALDALAAEAMAEWKVPAAAIAVVQNGETTLLRAWGQRDAEAALPATPQTQFLICSISKMFTATGLALLVDEGRLDWSKPVRDYVPELRLHDPVATERVTVRDLLSHHSGLPRHDWVWMPGGLSRMELLTALRHLEPSRDIRTLWQYSNLAYNAASIVTERISGRSFEEFTRTRLTDRLRMPVSFSAEEFAAAGDAAVPYLVHGEACRRIKYWPIAATAAGAINMSVEAVANWLKFLLAEGEFEGERLLSAALIREMQMPRVHESAPEFEEFGHGHYGLGFRSTTYRGERAVGHSGGWLGWSTLLRLMPEQKLGIAVFTNTGNNPVPSILINHIADHACGNEPVPWLDRLRDMHRKALAQQKSDEAAPPARKPNTRPSHDLADYTGVYEHPAYGRMVITQAGDGLHWAWRGLSSVLSHRHYDTFELPEIIGELHPDRLPISFTTDRDGNIASLSAQLEALVADIVFARAPAGDCLDPAFRTACLGHYTRADQTHIVSLDAEGQLTLKLPFQPLHHLRPYQGTTFTILKLDGFRTEFRRGPSGAIDQLVYHQPNGTFIARRTKTDNDA